MPFKTRKQKESASSRKYQLVDNKVVWKGLETAPTKNKKHITTGEKYGNNNSKDVEMLIYVKRDLGKIVIFASLILGLQLVIKYFFF